MKLETPILKKQSFETLLQQSRSKGKLALDLRAVRPNPLKPFWNHIETPLRRDLFRHVRQCSRP
jgi:hypothetical protein